MSRRRQYSSNDQQSRADRERVTFALGPPSDDEYSETEATETSRGTTSTSGRGQYYPSSYRDRYPSSGSRADSQYETESELQSEASTGYYRQSTVSGITEGFRRGADRGSSRDIPQSFRDMDLEKAASRGSALSLGGRSSDSSMYRPSQAGSRRVEVPGSRPRCLETPSPRPGDRDYRDARRIHLHDERIARQRSDEYRRDDEFAEAASQSQGYSTYRHDFTPEEGSGSSGHDRRPRGDDDYDDVSPRRR
jgi:hypothetical protein